MCNFSIDDRFLPVAITLSLVTLRDLFVHAPRKNFSENPFLQWEGNTHFPFHLVLLAALSNFTFFPFQIFFFYANHLALTRRSLRVRSPKISFLAVLTFKERHYCDVLKP